MTRYLTLITFIGLILFTQTQCTKKEDQSLATTHAVDAGFKEFVSAFTTGTVKSGVKLRVELAHAAKADVKMGDPVNDKLFNFSPNIDGEAVWISPSSIEFTPTNPLISGKIYHGEFLLSKLYEVPEQLAKLPIVLQVINQSFKVEINSLEPDQSSKESSYKLVGVVETADVMDDDAVETLVKAFKEETELKLTWQHGIRENVHQFSINGIQRQEVDGELLIQWDGTQQNIDQQGTKNLEIPGLSNFKVMDMKVFHLPEQYVQIAFSETLQPSQNLDGIISINDSKDLKFFIDGNRVKVFPTQRLTGEKQINIMRSVRSATGHQMPRNVQRNITFELMKPNVRLLGKGVIMPDADGLILPFEAINLKAVDVRVIKIFENNIPQFLQVNDLDANYQLKRVGRLIRKKKIDLKSNQIMDYGKWNAFAINLSELIKTDPGAIYRVELDFKRAYSLYPCANSTGEEVAQEEDWNETEEAEITNWDNWNYYGGYTYYNWREREDPCSDAYYNDKQQARNILSSNLGLIVKGANNNHLNVVVTDIKTTAPLQNVDVDVYSYQQQLIGTGKTDENGMLQLTVPSQAFLLIAKKDMQRGYLKLTDGNSLSLSKFDVAGDRVQKGVKGMIYGERGVWRPGDSIFVTFILEDRQKALPHDHPIIMELVDPNGKLVERKIKTKGAERFYSFPLKTRDDAPTGNWTARVRIGSVLFTKRLRIETVKPNRLKINLDFGKDKIKLSEAISGEMEVKWLHGAVAGNLKTKVDMTVQQTKTEFSAFKDYEFDDPATEFAKEEKTIFDYRVNEEGKAKINANFKTHQKAPGTMRATFLTKVFEEGGDFSVDQFAIPCVAYNEFVGIKVPKGDKVRGMLLTDQQHQIDVATVNSEGEPISMQGLKAEVYKVEWRWWWATGSDNLASYVGRTNVSPLFKTTLDTKDGYGNFKFEIKYPDWGRYLIRISLPNGHSCGKTVYIDWPGWAGRAQSENPGAASMLVFSADKKQYKVGEIAELTFASSEGGRALVSIESGSAVLKQFWAETSKDMTKVSFELTKEMAPNVYASITLLQAHAQAQNDLPIRMYGVIPILVHDPKTRLKPVIEMPDVLEPEKPVKIRIREENGSPMTFTLAVVDEGLLDLTRFKTPSPWHTFYAREALSVKTWDMYDDVFGAFGIQIEQQFAIGGDQNMLDDSNKKAKRFKAVVKYFGPYTIGAKDKKDISFVMPRYIGSVKTMLVAANEANNAYGSAEKACPVRSPLMLLATLPRVLSPREFVKLPVTLFAMDEGIKNVKLRVRANDAFDLPSGNEQIISFEKVGEKDVSFDLQVKDMLGIGKIEVEASSGKHKATYEIELEVRPPNPEKTLSVANVVKAGEQWSIPVDLFGIEGTNKAILEVSGMPNIDLDRRLRYLLRYPYGCIEQTTSSAFPQLYLNEFVQVESDLASNIKTNIEAALKRLLSFQLSDGGFSYWPGGVENNAWGTNYAGHFLLEAERKGFQLPYGLKENWLNFQKKEANRWTEDMKGRRGNMIQAYRLYTLALANHPDLGAMNRLKESDRTSLSSQYMLALAYIVSGNPSAAKEMIQNLDRMISPYKEWSYTYGSSDRDQAIVLETLLALEMYDEAMPMIQKIASKLSSKAYMSTQTTAFSLRAMSMAASIFKKSVGTFEFSYAVGTGKSKERRCTDLINQHSLDVKALDGEQLVITNKSDLPLYFSLALSGIPLVDDGAAIKKNLGMTITYRDVADHLLDVSELKQGTDFKAVVTIQHPGLLDSYKELALSTMFPSGWEIINSRLFETGANTKNDVPTYQDIRDDRVDTFFDLDKGEKKTFVIHLNAAYVGMYNMPAVQCGAMYDDDIQVRIPGRRVKVVK